MDIANLGVSLLRVRSITCSVYGEAKSNPIWFSHTHVFLIHYVTFKDHHKNNLMLCSSHHRPLEKGLWGKNGEDIFGFRSQPNQF